MRTTGKSARRRPKRLCVRPKTGLTEQVCTPPRNSPPMRTDCMRAQPRRPAACCGVRPLCVWSAGGRGDHLFAHRSAEPDAGSERRCRRRRNRRSTSSRICRPSPCRATASVKCNMRRPPRRSRFIASPPMRQVDDQFLYHAIAEYFSLRCRAQGQSYEHATNESDRAANRHQRRNRNARRLRRSRGLSPRPPRFPYRKCR